MSNPDPAGRFRAVRGRTEALARPLSPEDQQLQAFPDASPTKWHRGHTTWFWETFLLGPAGVAPAHPEWAPLFNSYYESMGARHPRPQRGLLSRPSCAEVTAWRALVDERVETLLEDRVAREVAAPIVALGLAHEEQHQELLLTDILAAFEAQPLRPTWGPAGPAATLAGDDGFTEHADGVVSLGSATPFCFDNEGPVHDVFLRPYALGRRLVTVREWAAFAREGGYETPSLWLSDGLAWVRTHGITGPAYTHRDGDDVWVFGLHGERRAAPDEPIGHLSFYEADALATFLGGRLPTEAEWEHAARGRTDTRPEPGAFVPTQSEGGWFGSLWQWTRSAYSPYPGFRAPSGPIGEYNGKFMVNQVVLRGSSCLTPPGHSRPSYRNFWPPATRFQATGLRLARELD